MRSSGYLYTGTENTKPSLDSWRRYDSQYGLGLFNPSWPSAWLEPPTPFGTRKERDVNQLERQQQQQ